MSLGTPSGRLIALSSLVDSLFLTYASLRWSSRGPHSMLMLFGRSVDDQVKTDNMGKE